MALFVVISYLTLWRLKMNRYVKALNFIKGTLSAFHQRTNSEVPKKETEWLNTLQELTEKATPKEPNFNRGIEIQSWDGDCCSIGYTHDYWSCPNCNSPVNEYQNGCSQCLQALDWGEE